MHLAPLIADLAIILAVAGFISLLFERINQPVVLGYIIAGIVIGPHTPPFQMITDIPSINTWAELGVIFLMFSLGLEFSFRKLARVGGSAVITASMEVAFFLPIGYFLGKLLGWKFMDSLFLGAMLSISSTTIIIKALDELKLKKHRFAELIFAVLIVEDLFAILLLVALGTIAVSKTVSALALLSAALKLVLVVGGWFLTGYFIVPRFMRYVGKSGNDEMLTILSLGLCLSLVVFANYFHYSTALGAFIMGSILAETSVLSRIEHNMTSLRNLFGAIFFVSIGMLIDPRILWTHLGSIAIICLVTILGKILSTGFGALISGQSLRNSVQVGFGLAQIGEFSFIIAQLGMNLKVTSEFLYPIAVAVSLVTTFTTPYLIRISGRAAMIIEAKLPNKVREKLNRFALHAERRRIGAQSKMTSLRPLLRMAINGLTVSIIFILSSELLLPLLLNKVEIDVRIVPLLGWGMAMLMASPFIWAMLTAFRQGKGSEEASKSNASLRVLSKALTLIWVAALSAEFFPGKYITLSAVLTLIVASIIFYRRLETSYRWFEERFLSTFEDQPSKLHDDEVPFSHLAPWDAHLVKMEIHPNSKFILKEISDAAMRVSYGVNIVAIQRGKKSIVTPLPTEVLLPKDELILLGTDEQLEKLKRDLEESTEELDSSKSMQHYDLKQVRLTKNCPFTGQTIRRSGIRETFRAMVVGIDRGGTRMINPDSDLELKVSDVLWIAGERTKLDLLIKQFFPTEDPHKSLESNSNK